MTDKTLDEIVQDLHDKDRLVEQYPPDAMIEFDAGYNNITCTIEHASITKEPT